MGGVEGGLPYTSSMWSVLAIAAMLSWVLIRQFVVITRDIRGIGE